jgi:hypothetical protein
MQLERHRARRYSFHASIELTDLQRFGYLILGYHLTPNGCCPSCGSSIPGKWASAFQGQITARPFVPRTRTRSDLLVLNS